MYSGRRSSCGDDREECSLQLIGVRPLHHRLHVRGGDLDWRTRSPIAAGPGALAQATTGDWRTVKLAVDRHVAELGARRALAPWNREAAATAVRHGVGIAPARERAARDAEDEAGVLTLKVFRQRHVWKSFWADSASPTAPPRPRRRVGSTPISSFIVLRSPASRRCSHRKSSSRGLPRSQVVGDELPRSEGRTSTGSSAHQLQCGRARPAQWTWGQHVEEAAFAVNRLSV